MKLRLTLALMAIFVSAPALSRGGETGTLDCGDDDGSPDPSAPILGGHWSPRYLPMDQFRRLRARLAIEASAPVPGWESQNARRYRDRYFTQDGIYELLPLEEDGQR